MVQKAVKTVMQLDQDTVTSSSMPRRHHTSGHRVVFAKTSGNIFTVTLTLYEEMVAIHCLEYQGFSRRVLMIEDRLASGNNMEQLYIRMCIYI